MPYTYYIRFQKDDVTLHYYGVRFAKNAEPSDLGESYFSSSKVVKSLIEKHGLDCFVFQVRRVFEHAESAVTWEQKVLRRLQVLQRKDWINKSIGTTHRAIEPRTPEHSIKIGISNRGKEKTQEHKRKISESRKGSRASDKTKEKMSQQRKGRVHISHIESETTKFVTADEVQSYLDQGWIRGRKIGVKKGPKHTEEQRAKWSKDRKGKPNPTQSLKKKGMVNAIDLLGNRHYITKEEFDARDDLFGIRNQKVSHLL